MFHVFEDLRKAWTLRRKRDKKAEKKEEIEAYSQYTWRITEVTYFAFCPCVLTPEGRGSNPQRNEWSVHRQPIL